MTARRAVSCLALTLFLAVGAGGCAVNPSSATFRGIRNPVLLGPMDRIGGSEKALASKVIANIEVEAYRSMSNSEYRSEERWTTDAALPRAANAALAGDDSLDLRITDLMPAGWFSPFGVIKTYISVEADVVRLAKEP